MSAPLNPADDVLDLLDDPIEDVLDTPIEAALAIPSPAAGGAAPAITSTLVEVIGADIPLPALIKFVPSAELQQKAAQAAAYALSIDVAGAEGLQRADVALTALRACQADIEHEFAEPTDIAYRVHKRLTGLRGEWLAPGKQAIETVGGRMWTERRRLDAAAAEQRRKDQEAADRQAREQAARDAEEAAMAQAPAVVVEEMQRRAQLATAPPVPATQTLPTLAGTTTTTTRKARLIGTPADAEANPSMAQLTPAQVLRVKELMRAVLEDKAPITAFDLNWRVLNNRAKTDGTAFAIPGLESFEQGGVRGKASRRMS